MRASCAFTPLCLEAHNLTLRRGYRLLVEGLTFTVNAGELLQLSGANGVGKSTLLRALAGFLKPEAGEIRWHGCENGIEQTHLHYLGHKDGLRGALTPVENLRFAAGLLGGDAADIPAALSEMGVAKLADLPVDVLSAGQKRRVALARLILVPRPVWLLDEPLNALDAAGQSLLLSLLARHIAQGGMVVAATHHPLAGEGLAPRLLTLASSGSIAA